MRNTTNQSQTAKAHLYQNSESQDTSNSYQNSRRHLLDRERSNAWDTPAQMRASAMELQAQQIMFKIREHERADPRLFGNLPGEAVPGAHTRDMGGRFLINKSHIAQSRIFKIASEMPKGCHQHLHFNSEIPPEELFPFAKKAEMEETMFIRSTTPLNSLDKLAGAEIVFNVLPKDTPKADIFSDQYNSNCKDNTNSPWMLWSDFRRRFSAHVNCEEHPKGLDAAECWAREKMIITKGLAYNANQTTNGAWACFNQGTRAFKGLLAYEGIYRWYIGHAIDSMIRDKVMYAELRPMLMDKTIPSNDGTSHLDHKAQMRIIVEEVRAKKAQLKQMHQLDKFPFGLKIIYCTPRSISRAKMQSELEDCLQLKLEFPDLICGFDLVGAEDRPNSINFYADLLVAFQKTCEELHLHIPFIFHAGETLLDRGGSTNPENSNLYDALLLHSKRIGHGYSLLKHPVLVEKYKQENICLELCPTSNELLHLCSNAKEHRYPELLAAGLHCTLNADNPSLFRGATNSSSSLSYEFYQVMVGDPRMTIHGWKQLAEWSIEHSCLSEFQIQEGKRIHAEAWSAFCEWVVKEYGSYAESLPDVR